MGVIGSDGAIAAMHAGIWLLFLWLGWTIAIPHNSIKQFKGHLKEEFEYEH